MCVVCVFIPAHAERAHRVSCMTRPIMDRTNLPGLVLLVEFFSVRRQAVDPMTALLSIEMHFVERGPNTVDAVIDWCLASHLEE